MPHDMAATMKRAAGQIRKARRNSNKGDKDAGNDVAINIEEHIHQPQQPVRRKPTPEEAQLTAKNYRLAKELSDFRVRHREECKAVSRLTVENMNLATRWRDAVSQIAMLKRDLAIQQRRTAEALAQQEQLAQAQMGLNLNHEMSASSLFRQQPSQLTPSKTPSSVAAAVEASPAPQPGNTGPRGVTLLAAEMDRMGRILAAHESRPSRNQTSSPQQTASMPNTEATTASSAALMASPSEDSQDSADSIPDSDGEEKKRQSIDQPVTPSPEKEDQLFESDAIRSTNTNSNGIKTPAEVDFFARFKGNTRVDLDDDLDDYDDIDDPPLDLSPPVTPSESPPPSPPQSESPTPDFDNFDIEHEGSPEQEQEHQPMNTMSQTGSSLFPMTASPKLVAKNKVYNEEFPGDITSDVTNHPRSVERRIMPDFNDIQEEESGYLSTKHPPPPPLSSIDAFEASFATQFPESFSPAEDRLSNVDSNGEEYNPFFPSLTKEEEEQESNPSHPSPSGSPEGDSTSTSSSHQRNIHNRRQADSSPSPVVAGRHDTSDSFFPSPPDINERTPETKTANGYTGRSASSSTSLFDDSPNGVTTPPRRSSPPSNSYTSNGGNNETPPGSGTLSNLPPRFQTPPHAQYRSPESSGSDGPKRPEKAGAAAARARYEKALQPRVFQASSRRFPRRAEREMERGASPVNSQSKPMMNDSRVENNGVQVNTSKLAMAQARVKERAAAFAGRTTLSTLESKTYTSIRENQWAPRPSPTDSVASKPWDEEIGDIPMVPSSANNNDKATERGVDSVNTGSAATVDSSYSTGSPLANYTRQLRNRPWGSDSQQGESTSGLPLGPASNSNHTTESASSLEEEDSPTSRFIAAGKSRRSVKQPVSYAEPSLSAKLRRGDVFFPKAEQDDPNRNRPRASLPVHL